MPYCYDKVFGFTIIWKTLKDTLEQNSDMLTERSFEKLPIYREKAEKKSYPFMFLNHASILLDFKCVDVM